MTRFDADDIALLLLVGTVCLLMLAGCGALLIKELR
jgi:hypothetical protein